MYKSQTQQTGQPLLNTTLKCKDRIDFYPSVAVSQACLTYLYYHNNNINNNNNNNFNDNKGQEAHQSQYHSTVIKGQEAHQSQYHSTVIYSDETILLR